eukprot:5017545-Prymnesium_polylepis.1
MMCDFASWSRRTWHLRASLRVGSPPPHTAQPLVCPADGSRLGCLSGGGGSTRGTLPQSQNLPAHKPRTGAPGPGPAPVYCSSVLCMHKPRFPVPDTAKYDVR